MTEVIEWRDVLGYEGLYQVSNDGQVRSLARQVNSRWGCLRRIPEVVRRQTRACHGRLTVGLWREQQSKTVCVHRLVAEAFLADSYFEGAVVCHGDGDPDNNHVGNLRWGTDSDNQQDSLRHGTHKEARKTRCPRNHLYSKRNTRIEIRTTTGRLKRHCRTCDRDRARARYHEPRAA